MIIEEQKLNGWMTTAEAGVILGVGRLQIARLVRDGELDAIQSAGGAFLVNAESLERYRILFRGRGRPWDKSVSWGALWVLSGLKEEWLTYTQLQRLSTRLKNTKAADLVWAVRKRAETMRFRIGESFFPSAKEMISISGVGSDLILRHGLTPHSNRIEGYIDKNNLKKFVKKFHAVQGENANAIIHILANPPFELDNYQQMPVAVVAADLCASLDVRERNAGIETLKGLLNDRI